MSRADVKVGFACNNRCLFCAQGEKRRSVGLLSSAEVVRRLQAGYREGSGLVLTGGEPTIRKDLVPLVRAARIIGYDPIQIQTNGRMLRYADLVERLVRAGVSEISPALHGPTPEVHDALTGAAGAFDETVAGIANAVASSARVVTNTVVVRQNLSLLAETLILLHRLGVRHAQLALVHPVGTAEEGATDVVPPVEEAAAAIARAIRAGRAVGMEVVTEALPPCLLPGLEDAVVESRIPDTRVIDIDGEAFDFSSWRRGEGKAKGPVCHTCEHDERCEGPWREYPQRFGWGAYGPAVERGQSHEVPFGEDDPGSRGESR